MALPNTGGTLLMHGSKSHSPRRVTTENVLGNSFKPPLLDKDELIMSKSQRPQGVSRLALAGLPALATESRGSPRQITTARGEVRQHDQMVHNSGCKTSRPLSRTLERRCRDRLVHSDSTMNVGTFRILWSEFSS